MDFQREEEGGCCCGSIGAIDIWEGLYAARDVDIDGSVFVSISSVDTHFLVSLSLFDLECTKHRVRVRVSSNPVPDLLYLTNFSGAWTQHRRLFSFRLRTG